MATQARTNKHTPYSLHSAYEIRTTTLTVVAACALGLPPHLLAALTSFLLVAARVFGRLRRLLPLLLSLQLRRLVAALSLLLRRLPLPIPLSSPRAAVGATHLRLQLLRVTVRSRFVSYQVTCYGAHVCFRVALTNR